MSIKARDKEPYNVNVLMVTASPSGTVTIAHSKAKIRRDEYRDWLTRTLTNPDTLCVESNWNGPVEKGMSEAYVGNSYVQNVDPLGERFALVTATRNPKVPIEGSTLSLIERVCREAGFIQLQK